MRSIASLCQISPHASLDELRHQRAQLLDALSEVRSAARRVDREIERRFANRLASRAAARRHARRLEAGYSQGGA